MIWPALLAAVTVYLLVSSVLAWGKPRRPRRRRPPRPTSRVPLDTRLRQAGVTLTPTRYRLTVAASMVATFGVVYVFTANVPLSLLPTVAVGFAPRSFYRRRRHQLLEARVTAWPEAIRDVLTHLAADQTLHRALVELGRSGPKPLRAVWRTYAANATVLDIPAALHQVRADLADPVSDHVLEALQAAHDRGTTVTVTVLRSLADQVGRDVQLREQIITGQTEVKSQAMVAMVLPFFVLAFLVTTSDDFADFYATTGGWFVIGLGSLMAFGGWKLITTLGRIPDDPRVLVRRGER